MDFHTFLRALARYRLSQLFDIAIAKSARFNIASSLSRLVMFALLIEINANENNAASTTSAVISFFYIILFLYYIITLINQELQNCNNFSSDIIILIASYKLSFPKRG